LVKSGFNLRLDSLLSITVSRRFPCVRCFYTAGLDPRPHESGSTHKPRRVSKAGNQYLREALYMPALVAIKHDPHVKAFYTKLTAAGKKPLQAIVAVMRKLLLALSDAQE
jgi:transposase